jgi:predicted nucleic acid-binding protein
MLVIDAGALFEVLARRAHADALRARLRGDRDHAAPHVIDVEVLGAIRGHLLRGLLDRTAAALAIEELHDWPAQRFGHRLLLSRAWELRGSVRSWDAMYVALAEALGATLITVDERLARASEPRCAIEVIGG